MGNSEIRVKDGLSQLDREFPALRDSYILLFELDWVKVLSLMREYARTVGMDSLFSGQELAVAVLLLSMDTNRPDIRRSVQQGDGVNGLRGLLRFAERELYAAESSVGRELGVLVRGLNAGIQTEFGSPETWNGIAVQSSLLQALKMVQDRAKALLPAMLVSGTNEPAMALYAVFTRLHERVIEKMNELPTRRMDFYYRDVLLDDGRKGIPDRVHLILPLCVSNKEIVIRKGTEFIAGMNEQGREIIFATEEESILTDVNVADLRTLCFNDGVPWVDSIPIIPAGQVASGQSLPPYSLFGNTRNGAKPATAVIPEIGFAVASPVLFLQEGIRSIVFRLEYEPNSIEGTVLDSRLMAGETISRKCDAFLRYFKDLFKITTTCADGWRRVPAYRPTFHLLDESVANGILEIHVNIPHDMDGITPYSSEVHGENWTIQLPVFRFLLNAEACEYGADLLRRLVLRKIHIDVNVEDCQKLTLFNQIGPLSSLAPFQPFGPLPTVGNYLMIGCPETTAKTLTDFHVDIDWGGLPEGISDFAQWYDGYDECPFSKDFLVQLSSLEDGRWQKGTVERLFPANQMTQTRPVISSKSAISFKSVLPSEKAFNPEDSALQMESRNGFFKMQLSSPIGAFQHRDYPQVLAKVLTHNAKMKHEKLFRPMPKAPYTPIMNSIRVRYSAKAVVSIRKSGKTSDDATQPRMLYLHPWGWEDASLCRQEQITQISVGQENGSLHIGLRKCESSSQVSLYFHLNRDSEKFPSQQNQKIVWHYLGAHGWIPFPSQNVLGDSTHHFTTSGIIKLSLPSEMAQHTSIMPPGLFWIKATTETGCKFCCRVFSVYAQAIEAVRISEISPSDSIVIPTGSISQMRNSIAGVEGVFQLSPSWGGCIPENRQGQRTRMAERLQHKFRAYAPRDYERLVLERFPEVYKVKCFAGVNPNTSDYLKPGHILIVPIPSLIMDGRQQWKPKLSGNTLLEIEEFLKSIVPMAATIHVANPYYEKIQVRCSVRFKSTRNSGQLLNELNSAICAYLSPWNPIGYKTHFGWCARTHDLEAFIREQEYVADVTECSLICISPLMERKYQVDECDEAGRNEIHGAYPWSIAVPMRRHFLNVINLNPVDLPISLGIGDLEIGATFILQSGSGHVEDK